jgi:hypothetical protein
VGVMGRRAGGIGSLLLRRRSRDGRRALVGGRRSGGWGERHTGSTGRRRRRHLAVVRVIGVELLGRVRIRVVAVWWRLYDNEIRSARRFRMRPDRRLEQREQNAQRSSRKEACREEEPAAAAEGGREEAVSGSSLRWEEDPVGRSSIPDLG